MALQKEKTIFSKSGVNPDLDIERKTPSFNVEQLTNILDGGAENTRIRRAVGESASWREIHGCGMLHCDFLVPFLVPHFPVDLLSSAAIPHR